MLKITVYVLAAVMALGLIGCINATAPRTIGTPSPQSYQEAPDNRSAAAIRNENAQLRPQLAELEDYHVRWVAAVDARQDELKALKQQRDAMEDARDEAKKAYDKARKQRGD